MNLRRISRYPSVMGETYYEEVCGLKAIKSFQDIVLEFRNQQKVEGFSVRELGDHIQSQAAEHLRQLNGSSCCAFVVMDSGHGQRSWSQLSSRSVLDKPELLVGRNRGLEVAGTWRGQKG